MRRPVCVFLQTRVISALRLPAVPFRARPLAGEHEQQEQGQVPEAAEEQLPGALSVCIHIEPEAEVGNVQVDRERYGREGPRGDTQGGGLRRTARAAPGSGVGRPAGTGQGV